MMEFGFFLWGTEGIYSYNKQIIKIDHNNNNNKVLITIFTTSFYVLKLLHNMIDFRKFLASFE